MAKDDGNFWSRWQTMFILFIVIIALVISGAYTSYALLSSPQSGLETEAHVNIDDTVSVDYIGMFEDGTVFDTSIRTVAENDTLYPKSLSFAPKETYSPLNFTVGASQMIAGFDNGVIGMVINQTKTLVVPPEQGYGSPDESLIIEKSLRLSVPVFEWIGNSTEFSNMYMISPSVGTNVKNIQYGWNMTVFHIDPISGAVMVKNNPFMGEVITVREGWNSRVISIDTSSNMGAGEIVFEHLLSASNVKSAMYTDSMGNQFIITEVNKVSGTYTVDYNREVVGKTLIFKVTLLSLTAKD